MNSATVEELPAGPTRDGVASSGPVASPPVPVCRACGTALVGPWCHACGQASGAIRRRFGEALFGQTGKLLRTLKLLVFKPGELAAEIDENRDRNSLRPGLLLTNLVAIFIVVLGGVGYGAGMLTDIDPSGAVYGDAAWLSLGKSLVIFVISGLSGGLIAVLITVPTLVVLLHIG